MGGLNGGYYKLKKAGVFGIETVWVDTALAAEQEILDFADTYGTDRIMFGSDYPFGIPRSEKNKVVRCFSGEVTFSRAFQEPVAATWAACSDEQIRKGESGRCIYGLTEAEIIC